MNTMVVSPPVALPWLLSGPAPDRGPEPLVSHLRRLGHPPKGSAETIDLLRSAGIRGRGGAAFPTWRKWQAVAGRRRGAAAVLVNGAEGEPASAKDRVLMGLRPHLVLDGAVLAAQAIGASMIVLYVNRTFTEAIEALERALAERGGAGADRISIRLIAAPPRYIAGEESAAVHYTNGGDARPVAVPPRPYERGVDGRPTLVQNVETLALTALVARFGAEWLATAGTPASPGPMLVTISGAVRRPGVYEIPKGTTLAQTVERAGGRAETSPGILLGGYFGSWIEGPAATSLPLRDSDGVRLGCGIIQVLPEGACGLLETAHVLRYLASQSARQCGPCEYGLASVAAVVGEIAMGKGGDEHYRRLLRWSGQLGHGRGACKHPDGAIALLQSGLGVFSRDLANHLRYRPCIGSRRGPQLGVPIAHPPETWR